MRHLIQRTRETPPKPPLLQTKWPRPGGKGDTCHCRTRQRSGMGLLGQCFSQGYTPRLRPPPQILGSRELFQPSADLANVIGQRSSYVRCRSYRSSADFRWYLVGRRYRRRQGQLLQGRLLWNGFHLSVVRSVRSSILLTAWAGTVTVERFSSFYSEER